MNKFLAQYLADFNGPRHEWQDIQAEPGPWSTLMVILAVLGSLAMLMLCRGGC